MTEITNLHDLDAQPHANVFPDREPKTIRLALDEGQTIPPHSHPEREIVFYLLEGDVELQLEDDTYELTPNDIVRFDGDQDISPSAVSESVALLVLAPRSD